MKALSDHYPQAKIDFYTIPPSLNWVENLSLLNRADVFDKRGNHSGIAGLWKFSRFLKKQCYDLAITPHRSFRTALLLKLSGIPERVGFDKNTLSSAFTEIVPYNPNLHEVDRNLKLLEPLGIKVKDKIYPVVEFEEDDVQAVESWAIQHNLKEGQFVCLAPGSVWNTKRWPGERWGELAVKLHQAGIPFVWIGSGQDRAFVSEFLGQLPTPEAFGRFTLRQSAYLIQKSALLVSNDSAPTHMASAVGTAVITIFGPTVPDFGFGPYRENGVVIQVEQLDCRPCAIHGGKKCPQKHFRCMLNIYPDTILKKIQEILYVDI
ncbi:MAG: glycosyltransferase family 9 protein [Calditrichia bacterium]